MKYCQIKEDFSTKQPTLVSFLTVSTGSSQSKILPRYLGYVLVCLSLVTPITIKVFEKAMAVKLIEPSVNGKNGLKAS